MCVYKLTFSLFYHPTIAQLAERETVEAKQLSLGHWFESGWSEIFFARLTAIDTCQSYIIKYCERV